MSKGTIPAGATFDQTADEFFERSSLKALDETLSADSWHYAQAIWIGLRQCHPATRRRILLHALRLCSERRQPPPKIVVDFIEGELLPTNSPRSRPKDATLMTEVAHYLVRHPRTPHRKIAAALGKGRVDTIYRLFDKPEFWKQCAEQSARYDDERRHDVFKQYVDRFGNTFEYATESEHFVALSSLVPSMIDALEDRRPPLDNEAVRKIADDQPAIRSEHALRLRLAPVAAQ